MNLKTKISLTIFISIITLVILFFLYKFTDRKVTYKPKENKNVLINPLMGWAPEAQYKNYTMPHTLVYANLFWSDLEPSKGKYAFKEIEDKFNFSYWKSKNVKIVIRVVLDYPNQEGSMQIPKWLYDEINGDGTLYNIPYGKGFSPNYSNKILLDYHNKLIKALGERYNSSSEIAFIELGSIGHWGEWHTYDEGNKKLEFPSENIANKYVKPYLMYFPDKFKLMRRPFKVAKENNFGLFNDMIGDKDSTNEFISWFTNGYYNDLLHTDEPSMKDFWKTAPSGGEFANGEECVNYFKKFSIDSTLNQIKESHTTFIGPNCPADKDNTYKDSYDKILNTLGYRFVIKESSYNPSPKFISNKIDINCKIENQGVAPFYYNWPVYIVLINNKNTIVTSSKINTDLSKWLPGKTSINTSLKLKKDLNKGTYSIAIGIMDPYTKRPSIKFGNEEILDNYFKIGEITIK